MLCSGWIRLTLFKLERVPVNGAQNRKSIERWYQALAAGDFETIFDVHPEDVIYNWVGNTPVSGRIYGKEVCCNGMISEKLLQQLVPEEIKFSNEWTSVAAECDRVVP